MFIYPICAYLQLRHFRQTIKYILWTIWKEHERLEHSVSWAINIIYSSILIIFFRDSATNKEDNLQVTFKDNCSLMTAQVADISTHLCMFTRSHSLEAAQHVKTAG